MAGDGTGGGKGLKYYIWTKLMQRLFSVGFVTNIWYCMLVEALPGPHEVDSREMAPGRRMDRWKITEGEGLEPPSACARRFSRPLPYQLGLSLLGPRQIIEMQQVTQPWELTAVPGTAGQAGAPITMVGGSCIMAAMRRKKLFPSRTEWHDLD